MRKKGDFYEQLALDWLLHQGVEPVAQNYNCRGGEIDLIVLQQQVLCFIEVKFRQSSAFGGVAFSIPRAKQHKIIHAALTFISQHPAFAHASYRFDALFVTPAQQHDDGHHFEWIQNAFSAQAGY